MTEPPKKRKRNRPHLSCLACAKAKRMCSKDRPCTNCVLRKLDCIYEVGPKAASPRVKVNNQESQQTHPINHFLKSKEELSNIESEQYGSGVSKQPPFLMDALFHASPAASDHGRGGGTGHTIPFISPSSSLSPEYEMTIDCSMDKPADYIIRTESSYQRKKMTYYGPSSGPSLLLWNSQVPATGEFKSRFPIEAILDLDNLLETYYKNLHWVISLFDWAEFKSWLQTENISDINATIYMVLALACVVLGRDGDAAAFNKSSSMICPDDVFNGGYSEARLVLQLFRVYYLEMMGKCEQSWIRLGILINSATAMGYHRQRQKSDRQSDEEYKNESGKRSRIWYSIIVAERKCALFLGRPYSVKGDFYDIKHPVLDEYNFETSFRDNLNRAAPFYSSIIDETLSAEPNFDRLMKVDQQLSAWLYPCWTSSYSSVKTKDINSVMVTQDYYRKCYQSFLRSKIFRCFLESPDIVKRSYAIEQFFAVNKAFCEAAIELRNQQWTVGLHDLVGFAVDNALFYCLKVNGSEYFRMKSCAIATLRMFKTVLQSISEKHVYCAKWAYAALKIIETVEKHTESWDSPNEKLTHLQDSLDRNPINSNTEDSSLKQKNGLVASRTPQRNGIDTLHVPDTITSKLMESAPLAFGISDWEAWLNDLLGDSQKRAAYE